MKRRHVEAHFTAGPLVRDVVIGMSDGLTVPFALAAGLSGAVTATGLIITAGLAEVAAGAIAMGLGGYLAARGEAEHYVQEKRREEQEVKEIPFQEVLEVRQIFAAYGIDEKALKPIEEAFQANPDKWVDFMMRFELDLAEPEPGRARQSAFTIAFAYALGGMIPLAPYFFIARVGDALALSVVFTLLALLAFGFMKGKFVGLNPWRSALQALVVGGLAAGVAFGVAKLVNGAGG